MKILLIQPPVRDFYITPIRTQPLGLAYVAASLIQHGHDVTLLDCINGKKTSIPVPDELGYCTAFYHFDDTGPYKLYTGYYHFGMEWKDILARVKESRAHVFGIAASFTPYFGEALSMAKIIKTWNRDCIVVMGGAHASCDPRGVMANSEVDFVVIGEGERTFPALVDMLAGDREENFASLNGIGYREGAIIRINPVKEPVRDPDTVPYPARRLLRHAMDRGKRSSTMVITSRGCPHRCAYCSAHHVMGTRFRARSPEAVVEEMLFCRNEYGIECFDFEDDNLSFDRTRAKKLFSGIIDAFGENTLELSAMNGLSFASLDDELLGLMKHAGFKTINLSFVSSRALTKERMERPHSEISFERIVERAKNAGLDVVAYGIFGMPGQTLEEMVGTIISLMTMAVLIGPSIYYPSPGTRLFDECRARRILPAFQSQWRSSAVPVETGDFSRLDLVTLVRICRVINWIKGMIKAGKLNPGATVGAMVTLIEQKKEADGAPSLQIWEECLLALVREKSFHKVVKNGGDRIMEKIATSEKVTALFMHRAWDSPVY